MSIVRNSLLMVATTIIILVLNYFFNVALGWFLPTNEFGTYGVASSLITIFSVFISSGFVVSAAKFISEENDKRARARIVRSVLIGNLALATALSLIFLAAQKVLTIIDEKHILITYMIILVLFVNAVSSCYRGVLQGLLKFDRIALSNVLATLAKFSGIALVFLGFGATGAIAGFLIAGVIALSVFIASINLNVRKVSSLDKRVFRFALPAYVGMIAITFAHNADLVALKLITGSAVLAGIYQAALVIARLPYWISAAFISTVFPYLSGTKRHDYVIKSLKYLVLFIFVPSLTICVAPEKFLILIFPKRYLVASKPLIISVIALILLSMNYALMSVLQAFGKPEIPAKVLMTGIFIQLTALSYFIPKYGIIGAPLSTLISMLFCFILLMFNCKNIVTFNFVPLKVLRFLVASSIPSLVLYEFSPQSKILFVFTLLVSIMTYFSLLIALKVVEKTEISLILKYFRI